MKVSEAKTKVCPFIMASGSINFDLPEVNDTTSNINCICGDCMAWKKISDKVMGDDGITLLKDEEGYCKRIGDV